MQAQLLVDLLAQALELFDREIWHDVRLAAQGPQNLLVGFSQRTRREKGSPSGPFGDPKSLGRPQANQALRIAQAGSEERVNGVASGRSEERRVGKEGRS